MSAAASFRLAAALFASCASLAHAQNQPAPNAPPAAYEPRSGQEGKDVVWVPTPQVVVDKMLEIARVGPKDFVIDLGSGDGRTVITAARLGARAMGIEYNPDMVEFAQRNAEKAGVAQNATFVKADLFETSFDKASVITMFLLPDINLKLRPKILELKPGTRIVSNTFTMDDWEADATANLFSTGGCNVSWCSALLWIVPAKVAGDYKLPQGDLSLQQKFQMLSGTLSAAGKTFTVEEGRVRGEEISFKAGGREYRGRMNGKSLELR